MIIARSGEDTTGVTVTSTGRASGRGHAEGHFHACWQIGHEETINPPHVTGLILSKRSTCPWPAHDFKCGISDTQAAAVSLDRHGPNSGQTS